MIERMDPHADYHEIWLTDLLYEFPWDLDIGYWLAFYNTLTPPEDARLLTRAGEMVHDTQRRLDQMATLMWEMFRNGFDDPRGRAAARQMNRIHRNAVRHLEETGAPAAGGKWSISDDQYLYVLATTLLTPQRWLKRYGWRPVSATEREAAVRYFRDFGQHMGLRNIPESYEEFVRFHDAYEAKHVGYTPEAARLWEATRGRLADLLLFWLAPPVRRWCTPVAMRVLPVLLSHAQRRAFGLPAPSAAWRAAVTAGLKARRWYVRLSTPRTAPAKPDRLPTWTYPTGNYDITRIGPAHTASHDKDVPETVRGLAGLDTGEREHRLLELVRAEVAAALGPDAPRSLPRGRPFSALGFTSLSAVELRNRLSAATGLALPATVVFDHPTPDALAHHLAAALSAGAVRDVGAEPEDRVRAALATIPLERLRAAGLLDALLELADQDGVPGAVPARTEPDEPDGTDGDDVINGMETEDLVKLAFEEAD